MQPKMWATTEPPKIPNSSNSFPPTSLTFDVHPSPVGYFLVLLQGHRGTKGQRKRKHASKGA